MLATNFGHVKIEQINIDSRGALLDGELYYLSLIHISCGAAEGWAISRSISSPARLPNSSVGRQTEAAVSYTHLDVYKRQAYWASFCAVMSYATVFLLSLGYSSAAAGAVIAAGNLAGILLQPLCASLVPRAGSARTVVLGLSLIHISRRHGRG